MGNCQAAEAATVVIEHPGGKVERVYWSLSASQVMASNPGHYVALIITSIASKSSGNSNSERAAATVKHMKLLRPDDTLHIGHVYRLISFEDVLKEFTSKKHIKLSRQLVKHEEKSSSARRVGRAAKRGGSGGGGGGGRSAVAEITPTSVAEPQQVGVEVAHSRRNGGLAARHGQWRPALQSIAEVGS